MTPSQTIKNHEFKDILRVLLKIWYARMRFLDIAKRERVMVIEETAVQGLCTIPSQMSP